MIEIALVISLFFNIWYAWRIQKINMAIKNHREDLKDIFIGFDELNRLLENLPVKTINT